MLLGHAQVLTERTPRGCVVRVVGELDADTSPGVRSVLLDAVREGETVVDLSSLSFIGSAGLSVLIAANNAARTAGSTLTVRGATGMVEQVLTVCGLHKVLRLESLPR